jgi:prevent-host-death family protein
MTSVSISQLKINPARVIDAASDYPVAVQSRNKVKAYLVGKDLFEQLERYIEDYCDRVAIGSTDFSKGRNFEEVAKRLGI